VILLKNKITLKFIYDVMSDVRIVKEVSSHKLSMYYTMVQSNSIKNKYKFIKNHLFSVVQ